MAVTQLKRIGVLGTEGTKPYTSHIYAQWAPLLNPENGMVRKTGIEISHVWDKDRPEAEDFAERYGVPHVVDRYDAMVGQVDGVIQSGLKGSFWGFDLVRPYLEAGVPVLMDRPGAYSLGEIRKLTDLAQRHDCPLIVTNNHEFNHAVDLLKARARLMGSLTAVVADSLTDREVRYFTWHCIHGWYMLYPVLSGMVRRVRTFLADESYPSPLTVMECQNADGSPFVATLMRQRNVHRGWVKLFAEDSSYEATVYAPETYEMEAIMSRRQLARDTRAWQDYLLTIFSLPPMTALEKMIRTREMPQSYEQIVEKVRVYLTMHKSLLEDGAVLDVSGLEGDWTAPNMFPGYFPDGYFTRS